MGDLNFNDYGHGDVTFALSYKGEKSVLRDSYLITECKNKYWSVKPQQREAE